mgnify:CR=1 FL=1
MNMLGPNQGIMLCPCFVDYVDVYYFDDPNCFDSSDIICDDEQIRVAYCEYDLNDSGMWFAYNCTNVVNPPQEKTCGELFDFDSDRDIDLFDFAELQNDWIGD